jgi:hypothetical protein
MVKVEKPWGQVVIDQVEDGSIQAAFENHQIFCQYSLMNCGSEEGFESPIRRFIIKQFNEDQVQALGGDLDSRIDAAAWRGSLARAYPIAQTEVSITARLEWIPIKGPIAMQEITVYQDKPWIKIRYLDWLVNIVDIAHPGGTNQGRYQFYGAEQWKRDYTFWENVYFCKYPGDIGYMNITEVEDPAPLSYKGHFIMGVFNPQNGRGYGRVLPVEPTDIIKLLFEDRPCGLEIFPCYNRQHQPFDSYLFPVTDGKDGVLSLGQRIVDEAQGR